MTTDSDGITFEIDGIGRGESGLLEVSGRWYGVRGRRFFRPTLTVTLPDDGGEIRMLADLEHKPWAAQDGDPWRAGFSFHRELGVIASAELNVAPDITVELGAPGGEIDRGRAASRTTPPSAATGARTPVIRDNPARPRPRAPRTAEVQRLHERLAAAEAATTKERARRDAVETALEQERGTARRLQAELARLRAERELAETMQSELDTASTSLDRLRRDLRELGAERDRMRAERDEAQQALAGHRAEAERLRGQLSDAEAAVRRLTRAGREARSASAAPVLSDEDDTQPQPPPSAVESDETTERMSFPLVTERERATAGREAGDREAGDRSDRPGVNRGGGDRAQRGPAPVTPRSDRPLNPSLRGPNWVGRGIALVVLIIVIVALILVVGSTGH